LFSISVRARARLFLLSVCSEWRRWASRRRRRGVSGSGHHGFLLCGKRERRASAD
jgi:hypothetical protein